MKFQTRRQDQPARQIHIHIRMKFHQVERAVGGLVEPAGRGLDLNHGTDLVRRQQGRLEMNLQARQAHTLLHRNEQSVFGHIGEHTDAAPAQFRDDLRRRRIVELQKQVAAPEHSGAGGFHWVSGVRHAGIDRPGLEVKVRLACGKRDGKGQYRGEAEYPKGHAGLIVLGGEFPGSIRT